MATRPDVRSAAILVVHHEPDSLERLQRILERRFERDYQLVIATTAGEARASLHALQETGVDVALVLAEHWLPDSTGAELLAQVPGIHRDARRALLIRWGDRTTADWIVKASALGQIEAMVVEPWRDADEQFFYAITDLLREWEQLHEPPFAAVRIVGDRWEPHSHGLQDALQRSGVPYRFYEADSDEGRALIQMAAPGDELPIAVFFDGRVLAKPTPAEVADALGVNTQVGSRTFDVAIVGSGPAGLAAAVYGASEGLHVVVLESEAIGGQASSSSMIRNYLGFPRGLSGAELTNRAYQQAWILGAQALIGRTASGLRTEPDAHVLLLDDGSEIRTRAVVLATGVSYRRIEIESLESIVGRGVFYGAGVTEAPAMAGEQVYIVGGANSAGQATIFLSRFAARVTILIRGSALTEMSDYLVREIDARDNIAVRLNTVVDDVRADFRLRGLVLRDMGSDRTEEVDATALFVMIGAAPRTAWLPPVIQRDDGDYIRTGEDVVALDAGDRAPSQLETSVPGVFAVGDVRAGSMKRVAAAVGEGSTVIRLVHEYLASRRPVDEPAPDPVQGRR